MKKILITGATGFIGSFLVEKAIKSGFEVYAGIRLNSNIQIFKDKQVKFLELDFANIKGLIQQLSQIRFDFIIHNAGITQSLHKAEFYKVNYQYTRNFIEALIETGNIPEKFIYTSSLAAFGPGNPNTNIPICNEDVPNPVTSYGKSKLMAEEYIKSISDFPYIILRPTAVYGPREKNLLTVFKTINMGLEPYLGFKKQHVSFIFIHDLVDVFFKIIESDVCKKEYFISDGNDYSTEDLNQLIRYYLRKRTFKIRIPLFLVRVFAFISGLFSSLSGKISIFNLEKVNELECTNWICDINPLIKDTGFKAKFNLDEGIRQTIEWYKTNKGLNIK